MKIDIFTIARNFFNIQQTEFEKSLEKTHYKLLENDPFLKNQIIYEAIKPTGNTKLQIYLYKKSIKERNKKILDLAKNPELQSKYKENIEKFDQSTKEIHLFLEEIKKKFPTTTGFFKNLLSLCIFYIPPIVFAVKHFWFYPIKKALNSTKFHCHKKRQNLNIEKTKRINEALKNNDNNVYDNNESFIKKTLKIKKDDFSTKALDCAEKKINKEITDDFHFHEFCKKNKYLKKINEEDLGASEYEECIKKIKYQNNCDNVYISFDDLWKIKAKLFSNKYNYHDQDEIKFGIYYFYSLITYNIKHPYFYEILLRSLIPLIIKKSINLYNFSKYKPKFEKIISNRIDSAKFFNKQNEIKIKTPILFIEKIKSFFYKDSVKSISDIIDKNKDNFKIKIFENKRYLSSNFYKPFETIYERKALNDINKARSELASSMFISSNFLNKKEEERNYCLAEENNYKKITPAYMEVTDGFIPQFENKNKTIKNSVYLNNEKGKDAFFVGPTGSGKTQSINLLANLDNYNKICGLIPAKKYSAPLFTQFVSYEIPYIEKHSNFQKEARIYFNELKNIVANPDKNYLLCFDEIFRSTSPPQAKSAFDSIANKYLFNKKNQIQLISTHFKEFIEYESNKEFLIQILNTKTIPINNGESFELTYKITPGKGWWFDESIENINLRKKYSSFVQEKESNMNLLSEDFASYDKKSNQKSQKT
jgi:hypothetical protein